MSSKKSHDKQPLVTHLEPSEYSEAEQRFRLALAQSNISVFHHDIQGRCTWSYNCLLDEDHLLGKTDDQIMPQKVADILIALKCKALSEPGVHEAEVCLENDEEPLWCLVKAVQTIDTFGKVIGTTSVSFDISERKRWETHLKLLMREVNHRSRNQLAVLTSISRHTCANATDMHEFQEKFTARIQSLAKTNELITQDQWSETSLEQTLDLQLAVYRPNENEKIKYNGEEVLLKPRAVQSLGLAFGELSTNSAKYGALSEATGCVEVSWIVRETGDDLVLEITWQETGGPEVTPPEKEGFGSLLLKQVVGQELDGTSELTFSSSGLKWKANIGQNNFVCSSQQPDHDEEKPFEKENELRQTLELTMI